VLCANGKDALAQVPPPDPVMLTHLRCCFTAAPSHKADTAAAAASVVASAGTASGTALCRHDRMCIETALGRIAS
jgi:hypothetical protein